jgi:LPXTG-motif cell wall-anchored protein
MTVRTIKATGTAAGLALALVLLLAPAALAQYQPSVLGVSTTNPAPGATVVASGSGCSPDATVTFAIDGTSAGSTTASNTGSFSGSVIAPTAPGTYNLTASCGTLVLSATLAVGGTSGGGSTGGGPTLPVTGASSSTSWLMGIGAALVASGGLLLLAVRKAHTVGA